MRNAKVEGREKDEVLLVEAGQGVHCQNASSEDDFLGQWSNDKIANAPDVGDLGKDAGPQIKVPLKGQGAV